MRATISNLGERLIVPLVIDYYKPFTSPEPNFIWPGHATRAETGSPYSVWVSDFRPGYRADPFFSDVSLAVDGGAINMVKASGFENETPERYTVVAGAPITGEYDGSEGGAKYGGLLADVLRLLRGSQSSTLAVLRRERPVRHSGYVGELRLGNEPDHLFKTYVRFERGGEFSFDVAHHGAPNWDTAARYPNCAIGLFGDIPTATVVGDPSVPFPVARYRTTTLDAYLKNLHFESSLHNDSIRWFEESTFYSNEFTLSDLTYSKETGVVDDGYAVGYDIRYTFKNRARTFRSMNDEGVVPFSTDCTYNVHHQVVFEWSYRIRAEELILDVYPINIDHQALWITSYQLTELTENLATFGDFPWPVSSTVLDQSRYFSQPSYWAKGVYP